MNEHPDHGAAPDLLGERWWELLELPAAAHGEREGFLSLGGTSWAAVRLRAFVRETLGAEIPLALLLRENASLAGLREHLAVAPAAGPAPAGPAPAPGSPPPAARTRSRLAPAQRRMWMFSRIHPDSAAYNVVAALRMRGELDLPALRAALADVTARHDALRASLDGSRSRPGPPARAAAASGAAEPELVYADVVHPELRVSTVEGRLDGVLDGFVRETAERPVPLTGAPLWHAALLRSRTDADNCLVLSLHHIISDQHTLDLLLADLATAYAARRGPDGGQTRPTAAPRFADHAEAEADAVGDARWTAELAYWRDRLADAPRDCALPFRLPAPDRPTFAGQAHPRPLGRERSELMTGFVRDHAVTPVVLVLTCVAFVLAAWSGRPSVVLGMPASRRRSSDDDALVGFLVESLPVRIDLDGHADFTALLRHVGERQVEALEHGTPTFDAIVEALGIPTRPTGNPLFQVWVNDLSGAAPAPQMPGLRTEVAEVPTAPALFDLNFYLRRQDSGYRLDLVRSLDRIPAEVADELADQCVAVLDQVLARPDTALRDLSLVTDRARAAGADLALPLPQAAPPAHGIVEQVLATAARRPTAPALLAADGTTVPYGRLAQQVETLAARLTADGVRRDTVVAIEAARGAWLPVALLAVWRAGAVAALLDGTLPAMRRAACHELVRPLRTLRLHTAPDEPPHLLPGDPRPRTLPGASHVLFTSGTSGTPSAVTVPHGALEAALDWYAAAYDVRSTDRTALLAGLGHDPVLRDLFVPLSRGGTVVLPPDGLPGRPGGLLDLLHGRAVTLLHATPALLEMLAAAHAERPALRLDALRLVMSGGAPLTAGLARRLRTVTRAAVVNAYGATETPQIASAHLVARLFAPVPADVPDGTALPVGAGAAGFRPVVLAPDGTPAGIGQRGEILLRGSRLALGYLDDSGPHERFVPDPGGAPYARAYRTGDLGRLDPRGQVHVDGRADRQVAVNGYRIGLEEVESAAHRHPGIVRAAAALADDGRLVLRAVARPGHPLTEAALRRQLAALLPPLAVPSLIVLTDGLRVDANHKVVADAARTASPGRGEGPSPDLPSPDRPAPAGAPPPPAAGPEHDRDTGWGTDAGPAAAVLTARLRDLTGRDVDPDENFFDTGLNSMTLLRLYESLRTELPGPLSITDLFTHASPRALLRFLSDRATEDGGRTRHRPTGVSRTDLHNAGERRRAIRRRIHHEGRSTHE
ncbi:condensation domain-containing protein [Streptomyces sp. NPDC048352]|uniref:condensation domain-containing protein n=1 Tax=Streptomyces sp. NPDC048352 TaxID=3154718 RepID=UPI003420CA2F